MPPGPGDRDQARAALAADGVKDLLELAQLLVAADERRLERVARGPGRRAAATTRSARHAGTGLVLPLREWSPSGSNTIARSAARHGRLADQHGAGLRDALEAGGGVDEVAGDHPLVRARRA